MLDVGENRYSHEYSETQPKSTDPVTSHLQEILATHLKNNPRLTLNAISKKCAVSEPTLRRILKGQIKTRVSVDTIVDVLSYVGKDTNLGTLIKKFDGPVAEFLKANLGHLLEGEKDIQYSAQLNSALADPVKFLIYNLASGQNGTSRENVRDLFGLMGLKKLEELILENLIQEEKGRFASDKKSFSLQLKHFVPHFKATADFIKTEKLDSAKATNLFSNIHESVNFEAYKEILKIQRTASRKILQLLDSPASRGSIPMFALCAIDTLSIQSAPEIKDAEKS